MSPAQGGDDRAFIERALRVGIIAVVALAALLLTIWVLKSPLTPLAVAWGHAYLLDPLIDRFEARRIPRGVAIGILLLLSGAALFAFAFFVVPMMQREVAALSKQLPGYLDAALARFGPLLQERFGIELPASLGAGVEALRSGDFQIPLDALRTLLGRVFQTITGTVGALVSLLIIPVLAYYLLVEFDRIRHAVLALVPRAYQSLVVEQAARVDRLVSGFIRGQLTVCLMLGILYAAGFAAIGIDLAVVIGAVSGLLAIIPYVGGAVAFAAASGMCLLQFGVDVHLALAIGWYLLVQGLESFVLTPRIVGGNIGMHPVAVIVALMIGADLFGFLGLLIAVPLAAVVQVFAADLVAAYRASAFYAGAESAQGGDARGS
jgi:predicted PurR-regulated permease PerM